MSSSARQYKIILFRVNPYTVRHTHAEPHRAARCVTSTFLGQAGTIIAAACDARRKKNTQSPVFPCKLCTRNNDIILYVYAYKIMQTHKTMT